MQTPLQQLPQAPAARWRLEVASSSCSYWGRWLSPAPGCRTCSHQSSWKRLPPVLGPSSITSPWIELHGKGITPQAAVINWIKNSECPSKRKMNTDQKRSLPLQGVNYHRVILSGQGRAATVTCRKSPLWFPGECMGMRAFLELLPVR